MSVDNSKVLQNNENSALPTEDEIEYEASNGSGIYSLIRVAKVERKMFWIMAAMFFIISFIYSVARVLKDAAVIGKQLPASIFFLKFVIILPFSFISVGIIQKALDKYPFTKIFDVTLIVFAVAFTILGSLLLPFSDYIQIQPFWAKDIFADGKAVARSTDFLFSIALVFNEWTSSAIYVLSEMFGSLILSYLFMTFANGLSTPGQSARFVPLFYVGSNLALLLSGMINYFYSVSKSKMSYVAAERFFNGFFCLSGILCAVIYLLKKYLENNVTSKPMFVRKTFTKKKSKVKVGFVDGLIEMSKSKLLLNMSLVVLFYAVSTNIIESAYKSALAVGANETGEAKSTYASIYTSIEQSGVAVIVMILLLTPFPRLIKTKGWITIAILCPIITFFSAFGTFVLAYLNFPITNKEDNIFDIYRLPSTDSIIKLENIVGVICVSLMKISKYAAFDITKEALSMQIDGSIRAKYKGIFDGVFGKLGKSFGSVYGFTITTLLGTRDVRRGAPISLCVLILFCLIWFYSVFYLNRKYKESVENNAPIDIDLFTSSKVKAPSSEPTVATKSVTTEE